MTLTSALLLATSTAIFVGAASAAKSWAMSANSSAWLVLTLILYTLGNVIMLRLIREKEDEVVQPALDRLSSE